jgi:AcrR family transcriptional regulator
MIAATEGPLALSARRLATQSGTTTAAIYTLFGGMDSLRAALTAQALQDLGASLEAVPTDSNPADRLLALAHAYRTWALEHPNEYRSILSDALGLAVRRAPVGGPRAAAIPTVPITAPDVFLDSVDEAWHVSLAPLRAAFEAGLADGTFSGPESDAAALAVTVWASLHGIVSLELVGVLDPTLARLGGDAGADRFFEDALGRLIAGLVSVSPARGAHA